MLFARAGNDKVDATTPRSKGKRNAPMDGSLYCEIDLRGDPNGHGPLPRVCREPSHPLDLRHCAARIGKLAAMVSPSDSRLEGSCQLNSHRRLRQAREQARAARSTTRLRRSRASDGLRRRQLFVTSYEYDDFGRANLRATPRCRASVSAVKYAYTSSGYLRYVADDADGGVIWAAKAMNAAGQVTDEILRNGVETNRCATTPQAGRLGRTATAHADADTKIQDFAYAFDEAGSLRTRLRLDAVNAADSSETFDYDPLDRLTSAQIQIPTQNYAVTDSYSFNEIGNLTTKAGKTYKYGTGCLAGMQQPARTRSVRSTPGRCTRTTGTAIC